MRCFEGCSCELIEILTLRLTSRKERAKERDNPPALYNSTGRTDHLHRRLCLVILTQNTQHQVSASKARHPKVPSSPSPIIPSHPISSYPVPIPIPKPPLPPRQHPIQNASTNKTTINPIPALNHSVTTIPLVFRTHCDSRNRKKNVTNYDL